MNSLKRMILFGFFCALLTGSVLADDAIHGNEKRESANFSEASEKLLISVTPDKTKSYHKQDIRFFIDIKNISDKELQINRPILHQQASRFMIPPDRKQKFETAYAQGGINGERLRYRSGAYIPPTVNYDYIANKLPEKEDTLHVEVFLRCHIHRLVVLQPGTEYRMIYDFRDIGLLEHESCKDWSFQFTVEYYDPKVDHTMAQVTSDQVVIEGLPLDAFAREELKKEHFQVSDSHQWGHVANGYALSLNSPKRNYLISEEIEIAVVTKNICSKRTYLRRTDGELTSLPFRLTITKPNGEMVRFHRDLKTERMDYPLCIRDEVDYFESYIRRVRPHVHDQRIAPGVLLKSQGNLNDIASHFSEKGRYKLSVSAQVGRDENEEPIFTESNEVELIVGV